MNPSRARFALALGGATALAFSPVAAHAATPASPFSIQDDAENTAEPGDGAEQTSEPGDDAEPTSEPTGFEPSDSEPSESKSADETDETDADEEPEGELQTSPGVELDRELLGPVDDPGFWEEGLGELGLVNASCSVRQPDADDPTFFTVTGAAPQGTDWILAVVLADTTPEEGVFDIFFEPQVGESFALQDGQAGLLDLSRIILCSADLEASPDVLLTDLSGSMAPSDAGQVNGPTVETDVPAPSTDVGVGGWALLGVGAAAAGAVATRARKAAARR